MVTRTNVNDGAFLGDWIFNDDYKRDVNAAEQAVRVLAVDTYGSAAVIFEGLTVSKHPTSEKFVISKGRARDNQKNPVILTGNYELDIPAGEPAANAPVYIAVKYETTKGDVRAAVKTATAYSSTITDSFTVDARFAAYDEAEGWIKLASAYLQESTWFFSFDAPNRSAVAGSLLLRNGLSIYTPGQTITSEWAVFGDQRFMPEWWDWGNALLHVILADAVPEDPPVPNVWVPRINEFVDLNVAPGTPVAVGELKFGSGGLDKTVIKVGYYNPYILIRHMEGDNPTAKGIIHYCGTSAAGDTASP